MAGNWIGDISGEEESFTITETVLSGSAIFMRRDFIDDKALRHISR
jgi:hypothetical protein